MVLCTGCNAQTGLPTLNSGTSSVAWLVSVGQSSGFSLRNDGPFIQRPFISLTAMPRLRSSAGFNFVGTCLQRLGSQVSWISATRTPTNGLSREDSERSQARTIMESDQNITLEGLILNSSWMVFANRDANRAAMSSKRGMVVWRRGATRALADIRRTSFPLAVGQTR